jgi:O-antigen biosynthesis protein WbqV
MRADGLAALLGRAEAPLDREAMARLVQGRRVMVTGAGGTIGGELARQLTGLGPATLALLDHAEAALYATELDLDEEHSAVPRRAVLADIRDAPRIARVMAAHRPELLFHAAALKHVPMVERDPLEGLLTNAEGTRIVADAARAAGCAAMVLVSTDKAVDPVGVMGASKRLAEMYCQALDREGRRAGGMRVVTVRFGNVLGSQGSVVPLFARQIARGGPVTVTHPDMRRWFMTVREAVGLILQAAVAGADACGEGGVFVLDMGEPVRILDLARRMIAAAGPRAAQEVEIRFTAPRPGERLEELLFHGGEPAEPTPFPGLLTARPGAADARLLARAFDAIARACREGRESAALSHVARLIPGFVATPREARAVAFGNEA